MHRVRHLPTRAKYALAVCGVLFLTSVVPPAFGATSVTAQVARAIKIATKADKNAKTALKLAKAASTDGAAAGTNGAAGAAGEKGPKGDTGAAGATGATGPAGATGPQGAKGDKGEKGDKGATGDTGPQGPAGPAGTGGGGGTVYINDGTPISVGPLGSSDNKIAEKTVASGTYLVTAHVGLKATANTSGATCKLVNDTTAAVIDTAVEFGMHTNYASNPILVGTTTLAAEGNIKVNCALDAGGMVPTRAVIVAERVTSVNPTPTPTP